MWHQSLETLLSWGGRHLLIATHGTGGWAGMVWTWQTTRLVTVGFERALWMQKPVTGGWPVALCWKMRLELVTLDWTGMG